MGSTQLPIWLEELGEFSDLSHESAAAAIRGGCWLVPHLQAGPRKAHYVMKAGLIRTILLCGDPLGMMRWVDEDQARDGRGRPWRRCPHCSLRLDQLAVILGQHGH